MAIRNYCLRHFQAALGSLGQFSRAPLASLMTCLVIGITLALPMALFVILQNVEQLTEHWRETTQVTLYLKSSVDKDHAQQLVTLLHGRPNIATAYAISPEQGMQELEQHAGLDKTVLNELQENPLPWVIVVLPASNQDSAPAMQALTDSLKQLPEVDSLQLDMQWVKRIAALISLAQRATYAIAIFLGIAVLLIVNNSIRTATQNHEKEIEVIQLIGGTNAFIRRPFLYSGMIYGLLGGILAWQLVDILLIFLKKPIDQLIRLYSSQFQLVGISLSTTLFLLICSLFLGLLGSWLAVSRHIQGQA